MDTTWTVAALETGGDTKTLDAKQVAAALGALKAGIEQCPGNIGCDGIGEPEFQLESAAGGVANVSGKTVEWNGELLWDVEGKLQHLIREAWGGPAVPLTAPRLCQQGRPPDFDRWTTEDFNLKNSCMNYAIDHRWDWRPGGAFGAHPSTETNVWTTLLAGFGVEKIDALKDATADGWPIALLFKPNELLRTTGEFHFLRLLPNGFWAHKFAARPPALCDFSGNAIPRDALKKANLCGYEFAAYYWVPKGTHIRNRTGRKKV